MYQCGFNGFEQIVSFTSSAEQSEENGSVSEVISIPVDFNVNRKLSSDNDVKDVVFSWNTVHVLLQDDSVVTTSTLLNEKVYKVKTLGIRSICCGWKNIFWITADGRCHFCEQGTEYEPQDTGSKFKLLKDDLIDSNEYPDTFCKIQTNNSITIAQTTAGKAFSVELINTYLLFRPLVFTGNVRVLSVSCGKHHTLLLTDTGSVYSFGTGSHGELGHGTVDSEAKPRRVEILDGVTISTVTAGGWHSVAVGSCGEVYVWGWNERGQLGFPCSFLHTKLDNAKSNITDSDVVNIQTLPQLLDIYIPEGVSRTNLDDNIATVKKVACGSRHTVALTEEGFVFSWGWNEYGQLGHGDTVDRDQPIIMEYFLSNRLRVLDVFAGHWNSAFTLKQLE